MTSSLGRDALRLQTQQSERHTMDVVISPRAERDLALALAYLFAQNERAGVAFERLLRARLRNLGDFPALGVPRPEYGTNVRCLIVKSLLILYRVEGEQVILLRAIDGRMCLDARLLE